MSDGRIAQLEETIHQEEKRFLMEKYAAMLLLQLELSGAEAAADGDEAGGLDDRTLESLLVARAYMGTDTAQQVAEFLESRGHEVEEMEPEDHGANRDEGAADEAEAAEEGGLFDDEEEEDADSEDLFPTDGDGDVGEDATEDADTGDLFGEGPGSADDEPRSRSGRAGAAPRRDDGEVEDVGGDSVGLFDDESDSAEVDGHAAAVAEEEADDVGGDGEGLFDEAEAADEPPEEGRRRAADRAAAGGGRPAPAAKRARRQEGDDGGGEEDGEGGADTEEDEDAGVLFDHDIYSGNRGDVEAEDADGEVPADIEPGEESLDDATASPLPSRPKGRPSRQAKGAGPQRGRAADTPGFTPTRGHEADETPGFTPTQGHEADETPGFTPTRGHEADETPGFTPTQGHEVDETPGFTPTQGHEVDETPGFTPTRGHDARRTPGFAPVQGEGREVQDAPVGDAETGDRGPARRPRVTGEKLETEREERRFLSPEERAEKLRLAQEERRSRLRLVPQAQEPEPTAEEPEVELDLGRLAFRISLEDLEEQLDISIVPDDRARLERRWQQKTRDSSMRNLLEDAKAMAHPHALIPRLSRFFRGGQTVQTNLVNLLRNFPHLFENAAQVITKYRAEPFFMRETAELDWVIVSCEVLPHSRNRNYMEQKSIIKQYALNYQANERRIQRRRLIDALYDIIVVNTITKEHILSKTVELTDTKVGRQNFACINFGDRGIRISDVGRQQSHTLLGMCPSW